MLGRFTVRPSDNGSYGVWDGAVNGWRANGLTEREAHQAKTDLDLQYDARGPRDPTTVRRVSPAQPVQRAEWRADGELDAWIRDAGQWLGRVRDQDGHVGWIPAAQLRPRAED
jgi:hypothetical protein